MNLEKISLENQMKASEVSLIKSTQEMKGGSQTLKML